MGIRFTVAIPTYNCAKYLAEALASVLAEKVADHSMQIIVVDDGSDDHPIEVVKSFPAHRIEFYRQSNQGPCRTFNTCIEKARGELIHLLHGDDKVLPGFYAKVDSVFSRHPDVGMFTCRCVEIDSEGRRIRDSYQPPPLESRKVPDHAKLIIPRNHIRTPGVVLRKEVYEQVGRYDPRLNHTQDWNMWLRASDWGPVWHEVEALAAYRIHSESDTSKKFVQGTYLFETRNAVHYWADGLSPKRGMKFRHIADLAVVRLALQDLAAHKNDPRRRAEIEELFEVELQSVEPLLRSTIERRFGSSLIDVGASNRKRVVIFGAGQAGRSVATRIGDTAHVLAFLDNNSAVQGSLLLDRPVLEPAQVLHLDYDEIVLASMSHSEMYSQLRFLGVDMRDVIIASPDR